MTNISKQLEQVVNKELSRNIIPVKTKEGILVGTVLIVSEGPIKHLKQNNSFLYKDISLNIVAVTLANMLAKNYKTIKMDELWRADQEYGKWYADSQLLRMQYQKSLNNRDHDKADMLWARYCESRDRAISAKNHVEKLVEF